MPKDRKDRPAPSRSFVPAAEPSGDPLSGGPKARCAHHQEILSDGKTVRSGGPRTMSGTYRERLMIGRDYRLPALSLGDRSVVFSGSRNKSTIPGASFAAAERENCHPGLAILVHEFYRGMADMASLEPQITVRSRMVISSFESMVRAALASIARLALSGFRRFARAWMTRRQGR